MIRLTAGYLLPLLPGLYAWQVHGWAVGLAVYLVVLALLVAVGWALLASGRVAWHGPTRWAVVIISMVLVAVSTMEACNSAGECHRIF